jgi:hypothetical protein
MGVLGSEPTAKDNMKFRPEPGASLMILTRKTLTPWVLKHMGIAEASLKVRHASLASAYGGLGANGKFVIMAVQKRKKVSDYTRAVGREETGINAGLWEHLAQAKNPVRLVVVHKGHVYLHNAPDVRSTNPHVRFVGGQTHHDAKGVAWWAFADFTDCTNGLPKVKVEPEQENSIIDFFGD